MISNYHLSRNNLVKSNSYHGNNGQYHRKSLVDNTAQQGSMMLPPMSRISRASTMSTIMEKQHLSRTLTPPPQQNKRNKKRHSSSSSNRISAMNLMEDDIPLALLAYKKGYTSMSPQLSSTSTSDRPLSSSMIQSNYNQPSDASLVRKKKHHRVSSSSPPPSLSPSSSPAQPVHKRKKKPVPYQLKTNTDSSTSQSSTVVATPTIEQQDPHLTKQTTKMSFKKKWLSSLRKVFSTSPKK
ncbi:uncharacterized protein ATC70_009210 [Mucor velutinosus]|uniref:Uncharacterized protein n=1 Tax=Mucor velutinosus TaxID=708070 RepID=A0AAN7DLN5_9FUNG|nr:hypothetical protein ATC70_009210 [Mucor velutinosus]